MNLRTRLAVLMGTLVFGIGVLATTAVATADEDPPGGGGGVVSCAGLPVTIFAVAGVPTFGDPMGPSADVILGTVGADEIHGLELNDVICGQGGNDRISGGEGNDHVFGQDGDDDMVGNQGMDVLNGGPHNEGDRGNGGLGNDSCPATEILISC